MACPRAFWRLHSPAMDVLNSIKVTIPPELREMLLEFVICYLIDRPTDLHSYAAAHFLYQEKLRHSFLDARYPFSAKVEPAEDIDAAVPTPVTPAEEVKSKPSKTRKDTIQSTMTLGRRSEIEGKSITHIPKKGVRIDEASEKAPAEGVDVAEAAAAAGDVATAPTKDEGGAAASTSASSAVSHSMARLIEAVMAKLEQAAQSKKAEEVAEQAAQSKKPEEVEEQATSPKQGDGVVEQAPVTEEQSKALDAFTGVIERSEDEEEGEDLGSLQVSAPRSEKQLQGVAAEE